MATLTISHPNPLPIDVAKQRIEAAFAAYSAKYNLKQRWQGNRLLVSGPADGHADVTAGTVTVELKLGIGASMFKGRVESAIRAELDKALRA